MPVTILKKPVKPPRRLPVASLQRWQLLCADLGVHADSTVYRQVVRAWGGRSRHYHALAHLEACLRELENVRSQAQDPAEVEFALWFHDAIYRTYRRDNEERSGAWAQDALLKLGGAPDKAARVLRYVLATKHGHSNHEGDAAFVVDIDLSILGEEPALYDEFERSIRREYWWVPLKRFARARIDVLNGFLVRNEIYRTPFYFERYEKKARQNINRAIKQLEKDLS